jgi:hypothetical protein
MSSLLAFPFSGFAAILTRIKLAVCLIISFFAELGVTLTLKSMNSTQNLKGKSQNKNPKFKSYLIFSFELWFCALSFEF